MPEYFYFFAIAALYFVFVKKNQYLAFKNHNYIFAHIYMLKIKIIALFLTLLLTLQVLPIAQIGSMISQNQWTEELPHNADDPGKEIISENFNHPYLPPQSYLTPNLVCSENKALAYIHHSEQVPSNHSNEVDTPPPDVAC
jgi:hypothetical protein